MKATRESLKALTTLRRRGDFVHTQTRGRKWVSAGLIVMASENGTDQIRVGFTVSKKISKSAVVRNRIKRRLRAAASDVLSLSARRGVDYVLMGRVETEEKTYDLLCKDLRWCLKRMDLLRATDPQ